MHKLVLPPSCWQVSTSLEWAKTETSQGVPLWIIILAILIGLLLLALLIYVLYKVGKMSRKQSSWEGSGLTRKVLESITIF